MTEKQQKKIEEMRKANAIYANVMVSFKDTPEEVKEVNVKLREYDENDPVDVANDDNILYYFKNIDEMVEAMDASNKNFDFTILAIKSFIAVGNPADSNGFEIKRGDYVFWHSDYDSFVGAGIVIGDPSEEEIEIKTDDKAITRKPSQCEINYDCINVYVTNIEWDTKDTSNLPEELVIPFGKLVDDYNFVNFGNSTELSDVVFDYISDLYGFCVAGAALDYDHEHKGNSSERETLVRAIKKKVAENGGRLEYYIKEAGWNGNEWSHEKGYFINTGINRFTDNLALCCYNTYDEEDIDILQSCFDNIIEKKDEPAPDKTNSTIDKIDKLIEELKAKIFRYVEAQDNKVILFDETHSLYINFFESEVKVQALGVFGASLCVYFDDDEWETYNLNDPNDVDKILDGDYWVSAPFTKENNECYIQTIYKIAKYLNID